MLHFLTNYSRPELAFSVHQCTIFFNNLRKIHEHAVNIIIQYLLSTKSGNDSYRGLLFKVDRSKSIDIYCDTSFAGDWDRSWSDEPSSVFSRTGIAIYYTEYPVVWMSKLQTEIILSTTEAEYITLYQSMREVIPMMSLLNVMKKVVPIEIEIHKVYCTIFEDINSCIELVKILTLTLTLTLLSPSTSIPD